MATSLTQILNWIELCNKLGGSSSSITLPNKGEIASNWGSTVYLDSLLPSDNKVLPNNGQVWPIKVLKYSTGSNASLDNAYTSQSTGSFNFRNTSWDSGYTYDYTSGKLYNQGSTVAAGYYMENDASNTWYHTNSSGTITESGTYIPKGFSFIDLNANIELGTSYNNTATHRCRSSETSTAIISQTAYNLDGTSSTTGNYVNASINNACTVVTFTRRSGGYDSSKPMVVVRYGFSSGGDLNTISDIILIHPPWSISSADITGVSSSGETVTPVVNTNMGDYTLISNKSWAVVSGTSINVAAQSSSGTTSRSATITVRARLDDSWGNIEYDSGNVDTTFTLTQNAYTPPAQMLYVFAHKTNPAKVYLSTNGSLIDSINAPAAITISGIRARNQNYSWVTGDAVIPQGSNEATINWSSSVTRVIAIGSQGNEGDISWSGSAPSGYQLDAKVIWD